MLYLLNRLAAVGELLTNGPFGLIVDVDGTISSIAPSPDLARVSPACRRYLRALVKVLPLVAAVSGRPAQEARRLVGVPSMAYVGNHGLERWQGGKVIAHPTVARYRRPLASALRHLRSALKETGIVIEDKGTTASIHYRLVDDPEGARERIVAETIKTAENKGLWVTEGRMVVEIRPPVHVDKGTAVLKLVEDYNLRSVVYMGDDITDVDAFTALKHWRDRGSGRALSVAVLNPESGEWLEEEADAYVGGLGDVERFLAWLAQTVSKPVLTDLRAGGRATS